MKQEIAFSRAEKLYVCFVTSFCALFLLSNLIAAKLFTLPFFHVGMPVGLLIYPLTFGISNLVIELYGESRACFMIILGFILSIVSYFFVQLAIQLPPHSAWMVENNVWGFTEVGAYQNAYHAVFGLSGISVFASLVAYIVSQLLDIVMYSWIREWNPGSYLWAKNLLSSAVAQFIDTVIVIWLLMRWGFHMDVSSIWTVLATSYIYKMLFALFFGLFFSHMVERANGWLRGPLMEKSL